MFDKLINFVINQVNNAIPVWFVYQYHKGCLYFCGKFVKTLEPGLCFKIPWLHKVLTENAVDTTVLLPAQSVMSADNKNIIVRGAVGYRIIDIGKYFNNVYDTKSAISDNACLIIRQVCSVQSFEGIKDIDLGVSFRKLLQGQVDNYGIIINFFGLVDITESRSYRLFNENIKLES